jgi:multiple sugar transport system ATP-binding protein
MVYVTHDQTEALTLGDRVAVMRTGTIQQVASPQELYERPVNLFVAGFIGSPAMNFLAGALEEGGLRTGFGDIPLSARLRRAVESSAAGRDVIVGIRPEDFQDSSMVSADVRDSGISFHATIDVVESLGSEKYVYFTQELGNVETSELAELARDSGRADTGGTGETVVARLDPATRISEGDNAELWLDARALHVFDPASGRNLTLGDSGSPAAGAPPADGAAPARADTGAAGQDSGSAATPPR